MTFSIDFCHVKHSVENLRSKMDYLSSKNVCSVVPTVCFHLKEVNFIPAHLEIYRSVLVTGVDLRFLRNNEILFNQLQGLERDIYPMSTLESLSSSSKGHVLRNC